MHTNNAAGAITRLLDWGVEPFLVASSVIGSVAQRLVRTICPRCRRSRILEMDAPERLTFRLPPRRIEVWEGAGCHLCGETGFRGRTGLFEVLRVTPAVRELINARASSDAVHAKAVEEGMVPLLEDGVEKALEGITTLAEVQRVAFYEER
ncbi:MAG: Flp pilus assembly complex ATPase component TadA, partial [Acetobacteraceae bacterium]|nr:Flp pilus assembly complex ATPase component TadA [Acetobacteraceae bacterium]